MGLALPLAYYFHRATTIGLPSNSIVVPLTQLMVPATVAALALGYISPWLAKVPGMLTFALDGITGTVHGLGSLKLGVLRLADLRVAMPSVLVIVLAATALVLAVWSAALPPSQSPDLPPSWQPLSFSHLFLRLRERIPESWR